MIWSDNFLVNEDIIDSHHIRLFEIINLLESDEPIPKNIFLESLTELFKYTNFHFGYEEEQMEMYNYPEKNNHIKRHRDFISEINPWIDKFNSLPSYVTYSDYRELFEFGVTWLTNHIIISDKNLAKFLNSKR